MRKGVIAFFIGACLMLGAHAATRADTAGRAATVSRVAASQGNAVAATARAANKPQRSATSVTPRGNAVVARTAATSPSGGRAGVANSPLTARVATRASIPDINSAIVSRAASDTRTGAAYEQCKSSYFACMDQFCAIKNTQYQRCSCSDRIYDIQSSQGVVQDAVDKLTVFNENLDTVEMTAAQAEAMKKASEGEDALTADKSAAKALLSAIMNSIKGADANVGGKYSDLNSVNIRMDASASFGSIDDGQAIASYNGANLYTTIYSRCREAVRPDCNDASLQRSVTAYLMAVEQDCNTVQRILDETKKQLSANVRESSAMLNLARIEDRQKHNSSDATKCLQEVEKAILSEQVCGESYHKCLDNGQFIDVTTGKPFIGVVEFYKLAELLNFDTSTDIADQNLSRTPSNRTFVANFEARVKQFAEPALDQCKEIAPEIWNDYLDKAMLDIFYAQKAKVSEIKAGCMDFVSVCYMNGDKALTASMVGLTGDLASAQPDFILANDRICRDYINACDKMFTGTDAQGIVAQYVENRKETDIKTACRAVVQQCFDRFGGDDYVNFYNRNSGLFESGKALDWFSFAELSYNGATWTERESPSECVRQLKNIAACNPEDKPKFAENLFGGFFKYTCANCDIKTSYGSVNLEEIDTDADADAFIEKNTDIVLTGIATEVYNRIINILENQCHNYYGRFVEKRYIQPLTYESNSICTADFKQTNSSGGIGPYFGLVDIYKIGTADNGTENMCPAGYAGVIDTQSWGACLCWENGGRRSANGTAIRCDAGEYESSGTFLSRYIISSTDANDDPKIANKVCPTAQGLKDSDGNGPLCEGIDDNIIKDQVPRGVINN
ncbi:MAG: hypothetical protein LBK26_01130 [Rickettsiales bacterium]|nr:hypothetical protein [Rickettsiales bacterium]